MIRFCGAGEDEGGGNSIIVVLPSTSWYQSTGPAETFFFGEEIVGVGGAAHVACFPSDSSISERISVEVYISSCLVMATYSDLFL